MQLINPSKSGFGRISKVYLSKVIATLQEKVGQTSGQKYHRQSIGLTILGIKKIECLLNLTLQISTQQFLKIFSTELLVTLET